MKFSILETMLMVLGVFPSTYFIAVGIEGRTVAGVVIGTVLFLGQATGIIIQLYKHRNIQRSTRESVSVVLGGALAGIGIAILPLWIVCLILVQFGLMS